MINVNKLLESKRVEVKITEISVDKFFVKQFRESNHLTQVALANILGVKKKTVEKWEQGANNVNGSSALLLTLLNDNPTLLEQIYNVKVVEGKQEEIYETIESKVFNYDAAARKKPIKLVFQIAAMHI